jgi:hypothetical protein
MRVKDFEKVLESISYKPGWSFKIGRKGSGMYLQIVCKGLDNVTGEQVEWTSRKWVLSRFMVQSEFVNTVFKAVMTAEEHETRELFKFKNQSIFDPHYNVEKLVELRSSHNALEERA